MFFEGMKTNAHLVIDDTNVGGITSLQRHDDGNISARIALKKETFDLAVVAFDEVKDVTFIMDRDELRTAHKAIVVAVTNDTFTGVSAEVRVEQSGRPV